MKRFYKVATSVATEEGFEVHLDGRPVRTPAKRRLALPNERLAQAISREWSDQGEKIDTHGMRLTRLANSAIDRVADCRDAVVSEVAGYAETDLVCYRAAEPEALRRRQEAGWAPLVAWIGKRHGIVLTVTTGLLPCSQPAESLSNVRRLIENRNDFSLTGLHLATAASGSIMIALALADSEIDADEAWKLSLVDETWQIENWGEDPETAKRRAGLLADIGAAETFMKLSVERASARLVVTGRVQGVGFRAWTADKAARLRVSGWVRNRIDGSVEAVISGSMEAVEAMTKACRDGPRFARVDGVAIFECPPPDSEGFVMLPTK